LRERERGGEGERKREREREREGGRKERERASFKYIANCAYNLIFSCKLFHIVFHLII